MSKEFTCTDCGKKTITERENTLFTVYSYGLCEKCSSGSHMPPIPHTEEPHIEEPDPLKCLVCGKIAKSEFGLRSHQRSHKEVE